MSNKIKLIVVSIILLAIVGINISYAISMPSMSSFFEVNSKKISSGEILEMTIDLSMINYNQFELVLNSNIEIEKIYADENGVDKNDIVLEKESNDIAINMDKEKLSLNKIVLYYQIPENIEAGTIMQLNAQVIISEDDEEKVVDEQQLEITIVEKNKEDNLNNDDNKNDNNPNEEIKNVEENINNEQQENNLDETELKKQDNEKNMQNTNLNQVESSTNGVQSSSSNLKSSVIQAETATYNGSNNNYLSSLEIDGVSLTSDFNKEKTTYFATVEGLETITVTATKEDSSSKVAITGTTLKNGENKVLISVTAENGDVRYYRIFVTNN